MKARVQKWSQTLALRIPKAFAEEAGLSADSAVEVFIRDGWLVVKPLARKPISLAELLRGVTDENLPGEWNTGPAVGKEDR